MQAFNEQARQVMARARGHAVRLKAPAIDHHHFLLSILDAPSPEAVAALERIGVLHATLMSALLASERQGRKTWDPSAVVPFSKSLKGVLTQLMAAPTFHQPASIGDSILLIACLVTAPPALRFPMTSAGIDDSSLQRLSS